MAPTSQTFRERHSIVTGAADPSIPQGYMRKDGQLVRTGRPVTFAVRKSRATAQPETKQSRRQQERRRLMERVRDAGIAKPSPQKAGKKRRRPGKKLVAAEDMGGMRDALPDVPDDDEEDAWEGLSDADTLAQTGLKRRRKRARDGEGKIQMRSLPHRPGAMKRKRRLEGVEMERFGRNLAQLAASTKSQAAEQEGQPGEDAGGRGGGASSTQKWAALRAFIGSTMERKDGFEEA